MTTPDFMQRVIAEKQELEQKLDKLAKFIVLSPKFWDLSGDERERLRRQRNFMVGYSTVLGERIEAFNEAEDESQRTS